MSKDEKKRPRKIQPLNLTPEEEELLRNQPLFLPLQGDAETDPDGKLVDVAMATYKELWKTRSISTDDYAFQASLRWIAAMYFFLGGSDFCRRVAYEMHIDAETLNRWLRGQSAPAFNLRVEALLQGEIALNYIRAIRREGAILGDVTRAK